MILLALLLAQQPQAPTVGDTVWVARTIRVPAGWAVESRPWRPESDALDALGGPRIALADGRATLRYPAVFWGTGAVEVPLPPVLLTGPAGEVDSADATSVVINIASVLPTDVPDSLVAPQPAAALVKDAASRSAGKQQLRARYPETYRHSDPTGAPARCGNVGCWSGRKRIPSALYTVVIIR